MKTILLVDDDFALVEDLTELLQDEGYRVVTAANGKEGLARLEKELPDLVITDLMMPVADGRQLLRGMRALPNLAATPTIMISSSDRTVALSDGIETLPVSAYIRKPFQWDKLLATIVQALGRGRTGQSS